MNSFFSLKIIAANKVILDKQVTMVIVPSTQGDMGVLKGHIDMLSLIKLGILEVKIDNNTYEKYIVQNGICKIKNGSCEILIRDCINIHEVDKDSLTTEISSIQAMMEDSSHEDKKQKLQQKLEYLNLCLKNYMIK